jgi:hypothetical protein
MLNKTSRETVAKCLADALPTNSHSIANHITIERSYSIDSGNFRGLLNDVHTTLFSPSTTPDPPRVWHTYFKPGPACGALTPSGSPPFSWRWRYLGLYLSFQILLKREEVSTWLPEVCDLLFPRTGRSKGPVSGMTMGSAGYPIAVFCSAEGGLDGMAVVDDSVVVAVAVAEWS